MKRGRPVKEALEARRKFTKEVIHPDGMKTVFTYDLDKSIAPIGFEYTYPKGYRTFDEINEELPITKRKYWNTANEDGGYVSYGRAKQLGII
jgi:hypothetical protein